MIEQVEAYIVTCDRDPEHQANIFARHRSDVLAQLSAGGWRVGARLIDQHICAICVEAEKPQRPADLSHDQYQALTDEEKQARREAYAVYMARFEPGQYPVREQYNSHNQLYADSQRAEGYNPPGVYC